MQPFSLLFRTDASARIGGGHAMRCLALAEAHRVRGGRSMFVMAEGGDLLASRLEASGLELQTIAGRPGSGDDSRETLALAAGTGAGWIVVDGYALGGEYQRQLASGCRPLLCVDDWGKARPHHARVIVDPNVAATASDYAQGDLLLGCRYALLRQEFAGVPRSANVAPARAGRFLITFGAADLAGLTLKALQGLGSLEETDWQAKVVAGPANPNLPAIAAAARGLGDRVDLVSSTDRMAELMTWADLAITAGGSTLWELAYCGVPMIAIAGADNQSANVERMNALGLATGLGWHEDVRASTIAAAVRSLRDDGRLRESMTRRGQEAVDGAGCSRVLARLARDMADETTPRAAS